MSSGGAMARDYPQLVSGDYRLLENGQQDVICLARFDASEIVIGVINANSVAKKVVLSLTDIISGRPNSSDGEHAHYTQDVLLLKNLAEGWTTETRDNISAEKLLQEGLPVRVTPRSCQVIKLRLNA